MAILPLSASNFSTASSFASFCEDKKQAEIIFFNTLAVCAVDFYFRCILKIPTELEKSYSWNQAMRNSMNVADLYIKILGRLECRPVFSNSKVCYLPYETCRDRIGYLVIQIDQSSCLAKILGFSQNALTNNLEISQLQSLDEFFEYIKYLKNCSIANLTVNLNRWFQHFYNLGWQESPNLIPSLRSSIENKYCVSGTKIIDLNSYNYQLEIAIKFDKHKYHVNVFLKPIHRENFLTANLQLVLLSQSGEMIESTTARTEDTCIKLKQFKCSSEIKFSILVTHNGIAFQEYFQL